MGSTGDCYDNANDRVVRVPDAGRAARQATLEDRVELATAIFEYLEIFHNRQRRHSALGMLTPCFLGEVRRRPLEDLDLHLRHPKLTTQLHQLGALRGRQAVVASALVEVGPADPFRRHDSEIPRSDAISETGFSRIRASSTARCRNSGG